MSAIKADNGRKRAEKFPQEDLYMRGLTMRFLDGALEGQQINVRWLGDNLLTGEADATGRDMEEIMAKIRIGDTVEIDNSDYIAVQTYHRHQVPGPEYQAWDQFRNSGGNPVYPQRPFLIGPLIAADGAGSVQNGKPNCRIILLESLMDESAFPWQADWYRQKVIAETARETGYAADGEDRIRLWYMENCMHTDCEEGNGGDHQHIVSYLGALYQALLDLSDWVERGIAPAATSGYRMDGGQVRISDHATERRGVQPVVHMEVHADGQPQNVENQQRAEVLAGSPVTFIAHIELPEGSGPVEEVCWDFENTNKFLPGGTRTFGADGRTAAAEITHSFSRPGVYFPVVKVASNRTPGDPFTKIRNQDRVRVIVTE